MYHRFRDGCAGSELRHIRFFNYFRDLYHMYGAKRKFMFGFHSEFSHNDNSQLKRVSLWWRKFGDNDDDGGGCDNVENVVEFNMLVTAILVMMMMMMMMMMVVVVVVVVVVVAMSRMW